MKNLLLKLYPDGTGTVSRKREFTVTPIAKSCRWDARSAFDRSNFAVLGGEEVARLRGFELGKAEPPPFPCQETQKSVKTVQRTKIGLSKRGRKTLRRAVCAFEKETAREKTAFITLTLSPMAVGLISAQSDIRPGELFQLCLSRFMERFRKLLRSRGLPGDVIWVTELHPNRSVKEGIAVPHVHLVAQTALKKFKWLISPDEVKTLWNRAFCAYVDVDKKSFETGRVEVKCVKKSVSRYVAKYMSKRNSQVLNTATGLDYRLCPVRWYAVANRIHKLISKHTRVISGGVVGDILDWITKEGNPVIWRHGNIEITGDSGRSVWLATWFVLSEPIDTSSWGV